MIVFTEIYTAAVCIGIWCDLLTLKWYFQLAWAEVVTPVGPLAMRPVNLLVAYKIVIYGFAGAG